MDIQATVKKLIRNGHTVASIARATGYTSAMISYVNTGKRTTNPSAAMVKALESLLVKKVKKGKK
jgi:uncharacterized protein YerC